KIGRISWLKSTLAALPAGGLPAAPAVVDNIDATNTHTTAVVSVLTAVLHEAKWRSVACLVSGSNMQYVFSNTLRRIPAPFPSKNNRPIVGRPGGMAARTSWTREFRKT